MTIGARLYRLENQVYMKNSFEKWNWKFHFTENKSFDFEFQMSQVDKKLDSMTQLLQQLLQMQKLQLNSPQSDNMALMINAHNPSSSNSEST